MTEVVNQHGSTPADLKYPVYRHSSETARSPNDAGGQVPVSDYAGKDKAHTPKREFLR